MFLCDADKREEYLKQGDPIGSILKDAGARDTSFATHRWLLDSLEKRMVFFQIYNDLIYSREEGKKILDVGGGFCSLTRTLLKYHDYQLLDIMAHDETESLIEIEKACKKTFWTNCDWNLFNIEEKYDIIIANDLFPNVDQRLERFLDKCLPWCNEIRLSLTYYNNYKSYQVKRVDADEIFNILAWDNLRLLRSLDKYKERIHGYDSDILLRGSASIFANGRRVCVVNIKGDCL